MKSKLIIFSALFVALFLTDLFFKPLVEPFDIKLRELMYKLHTPEPVNSSIVIIDIDTKTIDAFGQWPFSRLKMAQVLHNLTEVGVGIIGVDMVFSSPDRLSPHRMAKELDVEGTFSNSDETLAKQISNTPTILGYFFDYQRVNNQVPPQIPVEFKKINYHTSLQRREALGVDGNIEPIRSSSYSSGFFNLIGLQSALVDKVPLIVEFGGTLYPSLAFEIVRIISQSREVELFYNQQGLEGIRLNTGDIKCDSSGAIDLNYRGPAKSYKYLSFVDIYNGNFERSDIEQKIVLIGTSDTGLRDLLPTLYDAQMPGVEVHATAIDNLLKGDYLYRSSRADFYEWTLLFALTVLLAIVYTRVSAKLSTVVAMAAFFFICCLNYYLMFGKHEIYNFFLPLLALIFTTIIFIFWEYIVQQRQKRQIKASFSKKVSSEVVDELMKNESDILQSKKREVSIFFSDIRGFTQISERVESPEKLIALLNSYLEPMSDLIINSHGTIDKFIGDAIMAYWNAPLDVEDHADVALRCAIEQLKVLERLNEMLYEKFDEKLEIGIGINSDEAIVAEIGSIGRSDYTVIGDSVNLTSRCESLCKYYGVSIIITEFTKAKLRETFIIRELDTIRVVGKEHAVTIYEVKYQAHDGIEQEFHDYKIALSQYKNGAFKEALQGFELLNKVHVSVLYRIYMDRCQDYIINPPRDFDGIYVAKEK